MTEATHVEEPQKKAAMTEATHIDSVEAPPSSPKFVEPHKYVSYFILALKVIR